MTKSSVLRKTNRWQNYKIKTTKRFLFLLFRVKVIFNNDYFGYCVYVIFLFAYVLSLWLLHFI